MQILVAVEKTTDIISVWSYLNRYAFCNVQNELNIGIVVIIRPSWHGYVMICHFDVFCEKTQPQISQINIPCVIHNSTSAVHPDTLSESMALESCFIYFFRSVMLKTHLHWP